MKISVIMPVYNEETTVKASIEKVLLQPSVSQLLVVNDGSKDKTSKILKSIKDKRVEVINHTRNQGKGSAIRTALAAVKEDYLIIQDADLEYDPKDIPVLLQPVIEGKAEIVFGSRFMGSHANMFFWHYLGNKFLNLLINVLYNTTLSDMETCYKLLPSKLMKDIALKTNSFTIEPEITCKILKRRSIIYEVPISYAGRTYEEGKKIGWKDGVKAITVILLIRSGVYFR